MEEIIKAYLDERAKTDQQIAANLLKPNKSIAKCCKYIEQEALKVAKGDSRMKAAAINDDVVFGWAVHYYDEDDLDVDKPKAERPQYKPADKPAKVVTMQNTNKPAKASKKAQKEAAKAMQIDLFADLFGEGGEK